MRTFFLVSVPFSLKSSALGPESYMLWPMARSETPRIWRRSGGYSLTELLVAMVAGAVVLGATIQSFQNFQGRFLAQQAAVAQQQDARIGLAVLASELRQAGVGEEVLSPSLTVAKTDEIAFWANLGGLTTTLTRGAAAFETELVVARASGWPKGKRVVVCGVVECKASRLARPGRRRGLSLATPLGRAFPAGSEAVVANEVRYYMGKDETGRPRLMRMVDGVASTLIGDVARFHLTYVGRDGRVTTDPARVARVRLELVAGEGSGVIRQEIGLRA